MNIPAIGRILLLLAVANGAPVLAQRVLGPRLARPVDGGALFTDGRPVLGRSKTLRGLAASLATTAMAAPLLGLSATTGAGVAALAMAGDLASSFVKRRLGLAPSAQALGLDQIPESLLPALYAATLAPLSVADVALVVLCFFAAELMLSRLLYALRIREQPY